ncbi:MULTISPECIES: class I SAM-dependent methyltransferase [Pseudomonas]|uniref:Class I SAM-dependent methyltransferase n=1 Tax=Pseudomonas donghuensis TaxID=1163398 RepID=A0AAP0SEZ9_9PSED|nr:MULTISPECIES: class I SAM-dependent methyltransferase [Pseudomonas]MDF9894196.1 cyclopropane fatty-acyl-phospholipid synthase-like methyltransferase [Pseudomonas vranovensis]KDN98502.1 class I SAM-dependent methyltransferase [Pseudomonas donghuensis]MBF4210957.1 class I SAM-dependent methyltransferase [Pseudomonas donghuensis]MBS7596629.1 class I SAM-dependent methyltransferase [Pseudomonas sp. RC2C2]MCP6694782.1 class I SAM-dependent methyltransferase [Pseudomonas donghuensis]
MSKQAVDFMELSAYRKALDTSFVHRYSHGEDEWSWDIGMARAARIFLAALGDRPDQRILDVGVGRGRDASELIQAGHRVTGLDIVENSSWPLLRKRWGERLELLNSALQDWQPVDGRQFDAVLDNGCFHHQHPDEWDAYLAHMRSHVRQGGLIALNVFGVDSSNPVPGWREMDNQRQGYFFTEQGIRDTLESYGLTWQELVVIERQHGDAMYLLALVRN